MSFSAKNDISNNRLNLSLFQTFKFMSIQKETIYGVIVSKTNHYMSVLDGVKGSRIILDEVYKNYKANFLSQISIYKNKMINAPFILYLDVFFLSCRFDLDNAVKSLLDLLQDANAITNDKLCIEIHGKKHVDKRNPRVEFWLQEIQPTLF